MLIRKQVSGGDALRISARDYNSLLSSLSPRPLACEGIGLKASITKPTMLWPGASEPDFFANSPYQDMFSMGRAVVLYGIGGFQSNIENATLLGWHVSLGAFLEYGETEYESNPLWQGAGADYCSVVACITGGRFPIFNVSITEANFLVVNKTGPGGWLMPRPDGLWQFAEFGPVKVLSPLGDLPSAGQVVVDKDASGQPVYRDAYWVVGRFFYNHMHYGMLENYQGIRVVSEFTADGIKPGGCKVRLHGYPVGWNNLAAKLEAVGLPAGCRFTFQHVLTNESQLILPGMLPLTKAAVVSFDCA